jgi:hypothetical protein
MGRDGDRGRDRIGYLPLRTREYSIMSTRESDAQLNEKCEKSKSEYRGQKRPENFHIHTTQRRGRTSSFGLLLDLSKSFSKHP